MEDTRLFFECESCLEKLNSCPIKYTIDEYLHQFDSILTVQILEVKI